jgi:ATP-dependent DNA helicase RecG
MSVRESQNVEWKESWRDEYLKWISGFANGEGGVLVIGRNDQGELVGLSDADRLMEEIPNKVRDLLGIRVKVKTLTENSIDYLEIEVEPHPFPVSYKGQYFIRSGSTKQELKGSALDHFLLRKHGRRWDGVPTPGVRLPDLDGRVITAFRKRAAKSKRLSPTILDEDDVNLLKKLHLFEGKYLKRAALLLFHPDPEEFVTGAFIKIGFFHSNSDLRYHDEIHGDLFTQMDKTMDFLLTKYLNAAISYEGLQRVETYPAPEEALREALLNAVAHKDYGSCVPIQISVHPDKIYFWNSAELQHGWTVETLLGKHESVPFNPDIAHTFFLAGMIESWGRGIERVLTLCHNAGIPSPEIRYQSSGLWFMFPFLEKFAVATEKESRNQVGVQVRDQDKVQVRDQVEEEILRLISIIDGEMDRKSILEALQLRARRNLRERYLKPALDAGLIEMTIPDRPNSRLQKYRLTEKGEEVLIKR